MKNRISIRGTAAATSSVLAVTALTSLVAWTAWGAEPRPLTDAAPVARTEQLPDDAGVTRFEKPTEAIQQEIRKQQRRKAERAARLARERAAREAREEREERASRQRVYSGDPRGIAAGIASSQYGWSGGQFECLDALWSRESGWDPNATNPTSGAYGIPQALPGSKMSAYGSDWETNPTTQIQWGLAYIRDSYGSPCGAWSRFQAQGWY